MRNEYGRTKLDFFASEERKRENFYRQYRLQAVSYTKLRAN